MPDADFAHVEIYRLQRMLEEERAYMNPSPERKRTIRSISLRIARLALIINSAYKEPANV